jgi:hypothetical protein
MISKVFILIVFTGIAGLSSILSHEILVHSKITAYLLELRSKLDRRVGWVCSGWIADDETINQGVNIRLHNENEFSSRIIMMHNVEIISEIPAQATNLM